MTWLVMALAGGAGAWSRFRLDGLVKRLWPWSVPLGTLVINVTGSLLLGMLTGWGLRTGDPGGLRFLVGTGFLGGYTTFSTASVELVALLREGRWTSAAAWSVAMLLLGFSASALGLFLGGLAG